MMIKKIYKVIGMDCPSCAMLIEGELEDTGVEKASCSYVEEKLEVEYDDEKIDESKIESVVEQTGYKLQSV